MLTVLKTKGTALQLKLSNLYKRELHGAFFFFFFLFLCFTCTQILIF